MSAHKGGEHKHPKVQNWIVRYCPQTQRPSLLLTSKHPERMGSTNGWQATTGTNLNAGHVFVSDKLKGQSL